MGLRPASTQPPRPAAVQGNERMLHNDGGAGRHWLDAPVHAQALRERPAPPATDWYQLADGVLGVRSDDAGFRERLRTLYRECAVAGPAGGLPCVTCTVRSGPEGVSLVTIEDGPPLDQVGFALDVFPDRGYVERSSPASGWRELALGPGGDAATVAGAGDELLVETAAPWRALVGSLAVSRLVRLQHDVLFLHAGSIGVAGQGVLLVGPKGAGKTTLSLALAARGHAFLGDEIAGVRVAALALVPLRRSLAVRDGPRAGAVTDALVLQDAPREAFPDGSHRLRAHADALFPGASAAVLPLRHLVFLRGFGPAPSFTARGPRREDLADLTPMGATLWGRSPLQRARDMLAVLGGVRCYDGILGDPEASAEALERSVEA